MHGVRARPQDSAGRNTLVMGREDEAPGFIGNHGEKTRVNMSPPQWRLPKKTTQKKFDTPGFRGEEDAILFTSITFAIIFLRSDSSLSIFL